MSRPRTYDREILTWIANHRAATTHQVLSRFFIARRKSASYGERVVHRLVSEGYLSRAALNPERGNSSRRVLRLTRRGWRRLAVAPPHGWNRPLPESVLEHHLQYGEVVMVRQTMGWRLVTAQETPDLVRAWLLRGYRNRLLNDTEVVVRERLERQDLSVLRARVLLHRQSGDIRFLLAVGRGVGVRARLAEIPVTGFWPPVELEMVCSDVRKLDEATAAIERWAKRGRVRAKIHRVAHHRTRSHPHKVLVKPVD
jgi:hypothetical protein